MSIFQRAILPSLATEITQHTQLPSHPPAERRPVPRKHSAVGLQEFVFSFFDRRRAAFIIMTSSISLKIIFYIHLLVGDIWYIAPYP
ncbi:uncharacterized protein BDW43DRAFT_260911 [Aspergillus alliaceus]|uniref:uncharacterized protein n=1 Tax=Petromyces alliaceus TaxID=209559 RepID=UPI0012A6D61F|nr:uncharacterized protein BDW43DRAFT_260911 [Aspergillus alliaceus]KAB8239208.1 hypothetical protein BDW43DRAFT_260911 [Aspergillus alliaceus]